MAKIPLGLYLNKVAVAVVVEPDIAINDPISAPSACLIFGPERSLFERGRLFEHLR